MSMSPRVLILKIDNPTNTSLLNYYHSFCSDLRKSKIQALLKIEDQLRSAAVGFTLSHLIYSSTGKHRRSAIQESIGQYGQPSLPEYPQYYLSITHAGKDQTSYIACALHTNPIGIDIEQRSEVNTLSPQIVLNENENSLDLIKYWTAKEAYIKALGIGFNIEPKDINLHDNKLIYHWSFEHSNLDDNFYMSYCWHKGKT
jgi:phosphopantetheinyl transferase